jgi:hypothetical protein
MNVARLAIALVIGIETELFAFDFVAYLQRQRFSCVRDILAGFH